MRHLGIDLGEARIGIATCGESEMFASPQETYKCRGRAADLAYIADYCRMTGAGRVVIGLPLNMDGLSGRETDHRDRREHVDRGGREARKAQAGDRQDRRGDHSRDLSRLKT